LPSENSEERPRPPHYLYGHRMGKLKNTRNSVGGTEATPLRLSPTSSSREGFEEFKDYG